MSSAAERQCDRALSVPHATGTEPRLGEPYARANWLVRIRGVSPSFSHERCCQLDAPSYILYGSSLMEYNDGRLDGSTAAHATATFVRDEHHIDGVMVQCLPAVVVWQRQRRHICRLRRAPPEAAVRPRRVLVLQDLDVLE